MRGRLILHFGCQLRWELWQRKPGRVSAMYASGGPYEDEKAVYEYADVLTEAQYTFTVFDQARCCRDTARCVPRYRAMSTARSRRDRAEIATARSQMGDGVCCRYGRGSVTLEVSSTPVFEASEYGARLSFNFQIPFQFPPPLHQEGQKGQEKRRCCWIDVWELENWVWEGWLMICFG